MLWELRATGNKQYLESTAVVPAGDVDNSETARRTWAIFIDYYALYKYIIINYGDGGTTYNYNNVIDYINNDNI